MGLDDERTMAIRLISAILENARGISSPAKMCAVLQQIVAFWKIIPKELRDKAREVFKKLWGSKDIGITTDPDIMKENTEVTFEDQRCEYLYYLLSDPDRSALRLGQIMKIQRMRGLEDAVVRTKDGLFKKFGARGLSIGHMITTNDILHFFIECETLFGSVSTKKDIDAKKELILEKFNWWATNYTSFALLIEPNELENVFELENRIISTAENTETKFILIHLISSLENINKLHLGIKSLKENQRLNYREIKLVIDPNAFQYESSVKLEFD